VTRGQLPQRAGLPGLNGGGASAAVPPTDRQADIYYCTQQSWRVAIVNKTEKFYCYQLFMLCTQAV